MRSTGRTKGAALLVALTTGLGLAPAAHAASSAGASQAAWDRVPAAALPSGKARRVAPKRFAAFRLDPRALSATLDGAPKQRGGGPSLTLSVPTPAGDFERFAVRETSVMEPGLAAAHPEIKTYEGRSLDHPGASGAFELTSLGFTGSVTGGDAGSYYLDPVKAGDATDHVAYLRTALPEPPADQAFVERELGDQFSQRAATTSAARAAGDPVALKTYRLALLSDPSYFQNNGDAKGTTDAKAVLVARLNQLYERDLAIRLVLIAGNDKLNLDDDAKATLANGPCGADPCFTTAELTTCDGITLDRTNFVAGLLAGARNYDIGHIVLGKNGGGIAGLGVVGGTSKAEGCTGTPRPYGDAFAVDYVAHEMGHEFGANHTFAGNQGSCGGGNENAPTGVEPGSGSTVMAYAGICLTDDLQPHSDPYFSQRSIDEVTTYTSRAPTSPSSVQQTAFTGLTASATYKVTYNGGAPSAIALTGSSTAADIKLVIEGLLGGAGTVTIGAPSAAGYSVTFGGGLAGKPAGLLGLTQFSVGTSGFVGETQAGGPTGERGTQTVNGDHVPAVATAAAYTIPLRTPFTLTATGNDVDNDPLTYLWEQNDVPAGTSPPSGTPLIGNAKLSGPLFRVFGVAARYSDPVNDPYKTPSPGENAATADPSRAFPDALQVVADRTNANTGTCPAVGPGAVPSTTVDCYSEFLPTSSYTGTAGSRALHFRVTARDLRGGAAFADTTLNLASNADPFRITSPGATMTVGTGTTLPVTWNPANTCLAPVSTADVRITLSIDGGATFPYVLAAQTPNDGAASVALPAGVTTSTGHIRVEAVGNVFYDASRGDLTITDGGPTAPDPPVGASTAPGATCPPTRSVATVVPDGSTTSTSTSTTTASPPAPTSTAPAGPAGPAAAPASSTTTAAPAPPPSAAARSTQLAANALGVTPTALGRIGNLRFYATSTSTRLGKPRSRRVLFVAVCTDAPCTATTTASLRLTNRRTDRVTRRALALGTLRLAPERVGQVTLRLSAAQRRAIRAARAATVSVTVRSGTGRLARAYRLTVG